MDLYERSAQRLGEGVDRRRCEQGGLDLEGAKKRPSVESDREEDISKD